MFDPKKPPPTKKSSLTPAFPSTQLARVDFRASDPLAPGQGESRAAYDLRTLLAATLERSKGESLKTQERPQPPTLNIKIVTYGDPPQTPPVIHLDDPPQTTPEEFVQNPPPVTWTPGDGEGPKTTPEDPKTGVPVTYTPGTAINVGSGWASTRVSSQTLVNCSGGDEVDELTTQARKLSELAGKAEQGGPSYWDQQAKTHEGNAARAESQHRPQLIEPELRRAKEAREIAGDLRSRGIPDKPDPKMKDKKKLAQLEKQRAAAIQGLRDQARDLRSRSQALLRDL